MRFCVYLARVIFIIVVYYSYRCQKLKFFLVSFYFVSPFVFGFP